MRDNKHNSVEVFLRKFVHPPTFIERMQEKAIQDKVPAIFVGLQEGLILKGLCSLPHVEKVVEIGTQFGCSASWMGQALGERGQVFCLEKSQELVDRAQQNLSENRESIGNCQFHFYVGDARENLPKIENSGPFDLIFIDANKSAYPDYWDWATANIGSGGIVVADNIFLGGLMFSAECPDPQKKTMWKNMNRFLEKIFSDQEMSSSILPTEEGLSLSIRKS